ncbi:MULTISPECIES: Mor transcription activator family protein [unclassified Pseudomonas]|uniref:Mor transcription activator family protein n=1 Tax=unclassified Pseudomonas TaxID=196821 RepID=UPI000ADE320B|nr:MULTISPECIES: Mor transcription activator family protein [unclassified Pseudomonas]MBD9463948.1 DNA-binding protein [Pseudomonas sp. Pdm06]
MNDFRSKGPELLVDLTEHVAGALRELVSMDDEAARHVAKEVTDRMAAHWGGQNVYFPMGLAGKLSRRDRQIYEEFNGTNQSDLARKWGVSLQWIYKIVKAVRKDEIARRQADMFAPPVDD